jgi:hypothetical protein
MPSSRSADTRSGALTLVENPTGLGTLADLSDTDPLPEPRFDHLKSMTDHRGLWEHAEFASARHEHGYCTDDNARALIVVTRVQDPSPDLVDLAEVYLAFLTDAQLPGGGFVNRRNPDGSWSHGVGSDDSQGRALWALGTVAARGPTKAMRDIALASFDTNHGFSSPSPRANAFAVLGAGEVLRSSPGHRPARTVLERCVEHLDFHDDPQWPWPEHRLAYDNARIPEALLVAGSLLLDGKLVDAGLSMLEWLVAVETRDGHFSFTPAGGWTLGEARPGFDQQPMEAAAMADACARAWVLTGDARWADRVQRAARWFMGDNDAGIVLYDSDTGGCGDGLGHDFANLNQGAESTLAALSALQRAQIVH